MSWFFWALMGVPLASIVWLTLRKAQLKGLSSELSLLIFFIFTLLSIFVWNIFQGQPFELPPIKETLILLIAGFFAVLANLSLLYSFQKSANPGFSLAISSSKILLTAFGSVLFFNDPLSPLAFVGIFLVMLGIFFMYESKGTKSFRWGFYALLSAFFTVFYWLPVKFVQKSLPDLNLTVVLTLVIVPQIVYLIWIVIKRGEFKRVSISGTLLILAFGGVVGAVVDIIGLRNIVLAPNPGYPMAVGASYIIVVGILSKFFFKASLAPKFALASLVIIIGVVIIHLGA